MPVVRVEPRVYRPSTSVVYRPDFKRIRLSPAQTVGLDAVLLPALYSWKRLAFCRQIASSIADAN
jgi:hypothetical protein